MFWEMMRGIYKKLFAEFFLEIFQWKILLSRAEGLQSRIPNGICSLRNGNAILRSMSFISSSPAQSLTFMLKYINVYEEKNAEET